MKMNKKTVIISILILVISISLVFAACPPSLPTKTQALVEIKSLIAPIFAYDPDAVYPNIESLLPLILDLTEAYLSTPDEPAWQNVCNSVGKRSNKKLEDALSDAQALPSGNTSYSNCGGIFHGTCDTSNKPQYCDDGILVNNCNICGCQGPFICNTVTSLCEEPPYCVDSDGEFYGAVL